MQHLYAQSLNAISNLLISPKLLSEDAQLKALIFSCMYCFNIGSRKCFVTRFTIVYLNYLFHVMLLHDVSKLALVQILSHKNHI